MVGTALSRAQLADAAHPRYVRRMASVGVAQTPVQLRVTDAAGNDLPLGEVGEVVVKGDSVMAGYWRNPEATAAADARRLAVHRRRGLPGCRRLPHAERPQQDLIISGRLNITRARWKRCC